MTVSSTILRNDYVGNGSLTSFAFEFIVLQEGNAFSIKVILTDTNGVETTQVLDTDYTVTLNTNGTGTVNFISAPPLNYKITLLSNISKTQETDYINIGTDKFPADSHEAALDKLTLISQEIEEKLQRSILLPESSSLTNLSIPVSIENADKAIVVNGTGDNLDAKNLADVGLAPVTDFAKTLLDDNDASEALDTLGVSNFAKTLLDDNDASEALDTLGVSNFAKTLLDDNDAATARVTLDSEQKINSLTAITALEDADQLAVSDNSDSNNSKKITYANLKSGLQSNIIQIVNFQTGALATGTTIIPIDDTVPQNTEGDQFMTLSITPTDANSKLMIDIVFNSAQTANAEYTVALFKDSEVNALAAVMQNPYPSASRCKPTVFRHFMTAGTTSTITFKVRAGSVAANTMTFNGFLSARKYGGVMASSITITEIKA
jgi:hypothetical protein